jgi:hypothetical protein
VTTLATRDPAPAAPGGERARLLAAAAALLEANWTGASTVPSGGLYPHQWSWDTAFVAIGRSRLDQRRATRELESLFRGQWTNGMVPHIVFNPAVPASAYFPGPGFWQSGRLGGSPPGVATSGITQPPLHARAALEVYRNAADSRAARAFLARLYPKLVAQHRYLAQRRDPAGHGLAAIVHPWESGMDNSPVWDLPLARLRLGPCAVEPYRRRDLAHAEAADRPTDRDYDRFVYLASRYRDSGHDDAGLLGDSPFLVEDPLFNAIWLWSTHALAEIAGLLGADPAPHRAAARRIQEGLLAWLWDAAARRFCARDLRTDHLLPGRSVGSLAPLLDPELPASQLQAVLDQLASPHFSARGRPERFLVPSYDLLAPEFSPRRYWRGPVWMNTTWLLWRGLRQHGQDRQAAELASSMVELVRRSGLREYFDPYRGQGHGAAGLSWTAALLIDLLLAPPSGDPEDVVADGRGRADHPGRLAQLRQHDRHVAGGHRQRAPVDHPADVGQQQVAEVGEPAADHDQRRVHEADQPRQHQPKAARALADQPDRGGVALGGRLTDIDGGDHTVRRQPRRQHR